MASYGHMIIGREKKIKKRATAIIFETDIVPSRRNKPKQTCFDAERSIKNLTDLKIKCRQNNANISVIRLNDLNKMRPQMYCFPFPARSH